MEKTRVSIPNLLSAAAVLAGLIFVGYEIRLNTIAQRAAAIDGIAMQRVELNVATITDDRLPGLLRRIREGALEADLTTDEQARVRIYYVTFLRIQENAERLIRLGVMEREDYNSSSNPLFGFEFLHEQWPTLKLNFEQRFGGFLETEVFPLHGR